jgi:putative serine protease PepD
VGAKVARVAASSPAARAGLQSGDVITALDNDAIRNAAQLTTVVHGHHSGDEVTVKYTRDGADKTVVVHLGSRSDLEQQ